MLKRQGLPRGRYNQIANFAVTQSEINIAIGKTSPEEIFAALREQVSGGPVKYGGITDRDQLVENLIQNAIPPSLLDGDVMSFDDFLVARRRLMAARIKTWFEGL